MAEKPRGEISDKVNLVYELIKILKQYRRNVLSNCFKEENLNDSTAMQIIAVIEQAKDASRKEMITAYENRKM